MKTISDLFSVPDDYFDKVEDGFGHQCFVVFPETEKTYQTTYVWDSKTSQASKATNYERGAQFCSMARLKSFSDSFSFIAWVRKDALKHFSGVDAPEPEISFYGDSFSFIPAWRKFCIRGRTYWQQVAMPKIHSSRYLKFGDAKTYCRNITETPRTVTVRYDYGKQHPVTFFADTTGNVRLLNAATRRYEDWCAGDLRRAIEARSLVEVGVEQKG